MINEQTIRIWFELFHGDGKGTEARVLMKGGRSASGYFRDVESFLEGIRPYAGEGIYAPLNTIKDACFSRTQRDAMTVGAKATTSDTDILGRDFILVDLDPERASDTNSTDEEKRHAREVMRRIGIFLRDQGFESPIVADSANGYHMYYKVALENTTREKGRADANTELVKHFLEVLDMYFSDPMVKVDTSVYNAARISKVIGTSSNKGANTPERPQRLSCFLKIPDDVKVTPKEYIEKVASLLPAPEQPSRFNGYSTSSFDARRFLTEHGVEIAKEVRFGGGVKLILKHCPFDHNHKAPDAAVFLMESGAIGFKCLHNSCSGYTWKDVRLLLDPGAYDRRDYEEFRSRQVAAHAKPEPSQEDELKGKKWFSPKDIKYVDPLDAVYMPTGILQLDSKMRGLALGDVTVVSGISGAGKSSLINQIVLNAVQRGYKAAIWSGELQGSRLLQWIDQAAAGKNFVRPLRGYDGIYYTVKEISDEIHSWLDGRLWIYNNAYGNKFSQLGADMRECVDTHGTQLLVLDRRMSMNLDTYPGDKNDRETQFINEIKNYAKARSIHIVLICHPRKEMMNTLLRMESISGTADITNLADNVLLCHRVGLDFEHRARDFFGDDLVRDMSCYGVVIGVAKNRSVGVKDLLIGLYFEKESRRFKNTLDEHLVYGWQDQNRYEVGDLPY
ncbi:MAG: AAA family ATPase [Bacteroidales bacterium]|nr:AAA family ATPase [Bacteroidales bacterium]